MSFPSHEMSRRRSLRGAAALAARSLASRILRGQCPCGLELAGPAIPPTTRPSDEPSTRPASSLRICADPNNLPYSNREGGGFEDKIAAMLAADLGLTPQYTWLPQRLGFY